MMSLLVVAKPKLTLTTFYYFVLTCSEPSILLSYECLEQILRSKWNLVLTKADFTKVSRDASG